MKREAIIWTIVFAFGAIGLIFNSAVRQHGTGKAYVKEVPISVDHPDAGVRYVSVPPKDFMASEPGVVSVLRSGADWEVLQANDMGEEIHATPVILDGRIYLRTKSALYCFAETGS